MKNVFTIIIFLCFTNSCIPGDPADELLKNVIKQQVKSRIDNKFSVGTMVVFLENGHEEYFSYGYGDIAKRQAITKKSVFEIGSVSKTFTTLLLADFVTRGKLKLNDPIEMYLPDSVKIPEFQGQKITFQDLATHTSGLPRMPDNMVPKDSANPYADYNIKDLYAFLKSHNMKSAKGMYEYSNLGMALLAHTLSTISGTPYEEMLQETICEPLKLTETSTLNTSAFLTNPHAGTREIPHWDFDVFAGAGAIRSNGQDMLKYIKAQMGLTDTLLKKSMELTQNDIQEISGSMKIGLGWHKISENGDEIITHSGGTAGYRTFVGFSKKRKKAIIIFNNSGLSQDDLGLYFFNPSRRIKPVKTPVVVSAKSLQANSGIFQITGNPGFIPPGSQFDVKLEHDTLFIRLTGQPWMPIIPESDTRFFSHSIDASIEFFKNKEGVIDKLILYQDGHEIAAKKLP